MIHLGPIQDLTVRERSEGGDGLSILAYKIVYDDAEAAVILTQVTGLTDRVTALIDDNHPHRSGLVTVRVAVPTETRRLANGNRLIEIDLRLEKASSLVEAAYTLSFDAATSGTPPGYYVAGVHGHYVGNASTHVSDNGAFVMDATVAVGDENDAPALLTTGLDATPVTPLSVQVQQGVDPSLFEVGRARIEVAVADSGDWWTLTGDAVPDSHDVRVSNGLVRLTVVYGQSYLLMEVWSSDLERWVQAARNVILIQGAAGDFVRRWVVFRNDHAEVSVRCHLVWSAKRAAWVDVVLQRGVGLAKLAVSGGFDGGTLTSIRCRMQEWDGTNMATEVNGTYTDYVRRSTVLTGTSDIRPYVYGVDSTSTPSATNDEVLYSSITAGRFGVGFGVEGGTSGYASANMWRTNSLISDTTVL